MYRLTGDWSIAIQRTWRRPSGRPGRVRLLPKGRLRLARALQEIYFFLAFFTIFFFTAFFATFFTAPRALPAAYDGTRFFAGLAGAAGFMPSLNTPRSHFHAAGPHSRSLRAAMWPSSGYTRATLPVGGPLSSAM